MLVDGDKIVSTERKLLFQSNKVEYVPNEGVYVDNVLTYYENRDVDPDEMQDVIPLVLKDVHDQRNLAELGDSLVAFDPYSGQYEAYDAATLLDTKPKRTAEAAGEAEKQGLTEEQESTFAVGQGLGRNLTDREQEGFALLIFAAFGALGIIIFLYSKSARKKK